MIPLPGETPGAWWDNTGAVEARIGAAQAGGYSTDFDPKTYFLHDVPESVLQAAPAQREQSEALVKEPCRFRPWPKVPIRTISSGSDRFLMPPSDADNFANHCPQCGSPQDDMYLHCEPD
jgi:hypothetical protein